MEVRSRRGTARLKARVTKAIAPGTVFMPMHWGFLWSDDAEVNALTHPELCPISLEPELKACAVEVVPVILATPEQRSRGTHTPQSAAMLVQSQEFITVGKSSLRVIYDPIEPCVLSI